MKEILLTKGYVAIVDDDMYDDLSQYKWRVQEGKHTCYAVRAKMILGKRYSISMHRYVLDCINLRMCVDHVNDNGLDNRKSNLRICSYSDNQHNKRSFHGTSVHKGIFFHSKRNKWRAQICFDNKTCYIGDYDSETDAAMAYNRSALQKFGEFARLNVIV